MTPEERATVIRSLSRSTWQSKLSLLLLAEQIRQAENDALERAAQTIERQCAKGERDYQLAASIAAIRALKHPN